MSPKNSLISVRVPEELKEQAAAVLAEYGLTVSDAARILLTRVVKENRLPSCLQSSPEEYDAWFRAKVREAMDNPNPSISHEQFKAEIRERLARNSA